MGSSYYSCFEIRKTRLSQEDTKRELTPQAHVAGKARPGERRRAKEFPEHYFLALLPPPPDVITGQVASARVSAGSWLSGSDDKIPLGVSLGLRRTGPLG